MGEITLTDEDWRLFSERLAEFRRSLPETQQAMLDGMAVACVDEAAEAEVEGHTMLQAVQLGLTRALAKAQADEAYHQGIRQGLKDAHVIYSIGEDGKQVP